MKLKTLAVVVGVLALLSVLAYWLNRPEAPASTDARVGQPLADPGAIAKASVLRLTDQGKSIVLDRQPDNTWTDASYYDMPADFSKIASFVGDVTTAKIQRLVTTSPDRLARLEFKDSKIEFLDSDNHPLWSVTLGKNADAGGRFVRFGDEQKAYLANLSAWLDVEPKNWADAALLTIKADDIATLEIPFDQGGPVTVTRAKKDDAWKADPTPKGDTLKADKITSVLGSVGSVRFSDTSDLNDPAVAIAKQHSRTFKVTTFDGKTYTVAMGRKPEEKKLKPVEKKPDAPAVKDATKPDAAGAKPDPAAKPPEPEYDTIPAGPVYVWITSSDSKSPVNALMQKRAFQVEEFMFTGLPQKSDELFDAPPAAAAPAPEKKP